MRIGSLIYSREHPKALQTLDAREVPLRGGGALVRARRPCRRAGLRVGRERGASELEHVALPVMVCRHAPGALGIFSHRSRYRCMRLREDVLPENHPDIGESWLQVPEGQLASIAAPLPEALPRPPGSYVCSALLKASKCVTVFCHPQGKTSCSKCLPCTTDRKTLYSLFRSGAFLSLWFARHLSRCTWS